MIGGSFVQLILRKSMNYGMKSSGPSVLYKYFEPERIGDVLGNATLRASQFDVLNDPFEVFPDFSAYESYMLERISQEGVELLESGGKREALKGVERMKRHIRNSALVVCFTETNNNLLMWSHYAKSHTGFVLGFDRTHKFFSGAYMANRTVSPLFKVEYDTDRILYPVPTGFITRDQMMSIMGRKSADWKYEKEWRMFAKREACRLTGTVANHELFLLAWPTDLLTDIIMGPMMSLRDQTAIMKLRAEKYQRVDFFKAELSRTKYDLRIEYMFGPREG